MATTTQDDELEAPQGKTLHELRTEAAWFLLHTIIAVFTLIVCIAISMLFIKDEVALTPKLIGSLLAILVPGLVGFLVARSTGNPTGRFVWISGLLFFAIVCVWVLDLPTGNGLCEHCGALEKLYRTFFDIQHGSGLMGGDGLVVGAWIPFSLFGYAMGSRSAIQVVQE